MPSLINSDDGVVSGTAGLKTTGANDGILALQNNGTTNVTVTAAGLVGVGTTSPNMNTNGTVLHINNNTASRAAIVHMTNAESGSGPADGLICGKWSDGSNYFFDYDSNPIIFGTNGTNRVIIDTAGRMTMLAQPCFNSYATSNNWGWSNNIITAFNAIAYGINRGSCYNTSTQRFTAPVTGLYLFNFRCTLNAGFGNFVIRLYVNGTWISSLTGQATGAANDVRTGMTIVSLNTNDFVQIFGTGTHSGMSSGQGESEFSGYLLG